MYLIRLLQYSVEKERVEERALLQSIRLIPKIPNTPVRDRAPSFQLSLSHDSEWFG